MRFFSAFNPVVTICSLLLLSTSILAIYSSSKELAFQQLIFGIAGFLLFFFISSVNFQIFRPLVRPIYILITILLALVVIIGVESRGATRWIPLGFFNVQPSEFAKPALILFLADYWSKNLPSWRSILISILYSAIPGVLIFKQPDLGTTLTIMIIWLGILLMTKIEFKKLLILAIIAITVIPITWFLLQDYQKQRILSFISPLSDPLGQGYNAIQSTIAVGSGELSGRGLGYGTQSRLQFLPEYRTDFIFAAISEEFGFLGSAIILLIYFILIGYCIRVARGSGSQFGFLISVGVALMLLFQTAVNVGMNLGLLPITGITLPLISYGGSSLISTMLCLGFVSSVARKRSKVDPYYIG